MKTKLFLAVGLMVSTFAFGNNKQASKHDGTTKSDVGVITLPVLQWVSLADDKSKENSNFLINSYIRENLEYHETALNCNTQGTAVVQYTVTGFGEIANVKVVNSLCPEIDKEITSALKTTSGKWLPGKKNGKPVDMEREITVSFQIDGFTNNDFKEQATLLYKKGSKELITRNNPAKALKYFDKALKYLPNESNILYARGLAKQLLNDTYGALADRNRVEVLALAREKGNNFPLVTENTGNNPPDKTEK